MCLQTIDFLTRRYSVIGAKTLSNYWWASISLIGGLGFFVAGLYSYFSNFIFYSETAKNSYYQEHFTNFGFIKNSLEFFFNKSQNFQILFFPQGLSMCFYGLAAILLGAYLWFCIFFQIGCGFTEFSKENGNVRIFRLGFPGKKRVINYIYTLSNIQSICVKIPSGIVPVAQRGIYMRLKVSTNETRDIPLNLYSEKTSLENIEQQAADLSKFLRVSLSIL